MTANRPKYLNLLKIHLPVTGIVSLAHRGSGVVLFLCIPFCVWLLEQSARSAESYQSVLDLLQQPLMKLLGLIIFWSLAHHFFAGIRFLLIDVDIGVEKAQSRMGAWLVVAAELITVALLIAAWL